jgi:glycosyltransferase involved in cell wall biosynthesis
MENLELHICGYLDLEIDFLKTYKEILLNSPNIFLHGFVNINSREFKKLMEECSFVICSSWSEGCATAVITAMGNGGLIPLISRQCGIDIINGIVIENNTIDIIEKVIKEINELYSVDHIRKYSQENIKYIKEFFSIEAYRKNSESVFDKILENK